MSNYFDNANTNVTRRSYGSNFGKEITRKDLIPVKHREKSNAKALQELARFTELSKNVNSSKLNNLKNERAIQKALNEGYDSLKDTLVCDIMRQICIESLLVDMDPVLENLNTITDMVDSQVAEIGGFEGLKRISESTGNQLLGNMVRICEETAKDVAERNLKLTEATELSFELNDAEEKEFDYKKKEIGIESIVDNIKDKVLNVVKSEQKANQEKTAIMDDIQSKLEDTEASVNEAMEDIFASTGIEEVSLFESLMRLSYKGLIENSSSAIFENSQPSLADVDPDCQEEEYDMSEIDLNDDEEIAEHVEDDIDDLMINESMLSYKPINDVFLHHAQAIIESVENGDLDTLDETLDEVGKEIENVSEGCKNKKTATKCKESLRELQKSTEELQESGYYKKALEYAMDVNDVDEEVIEEGIVNKFREKVTTFFEKDLARQLAKRDYEPVKKNVQNIISQCKTQADIDFLRKDFKTGEAQFAMAKKHYPESAEKLDAYLKWLKTDATKLLNEKEREIKKSLKESYGFDFSSDEVLEEGLLTKFREKVTNFFEKDLSRQLAKRDYEPVKKNVQNFIAQCKTQADIDFLRKDFKTAESQFATAKKHYPESAEKLDAYLKWLKTDATKLLNEREKEIRAAVKESYELYSYNAGLLCGEVVEEGVLNKFREKVTTFFEKDLARQLAKRDYEPVKKNVQNIIAQCKTQADIDFLRKDFKTGEVQFAMAKKHYPESAEKLDAYLKWLKTDATKLLNEREKEIRAAVKESYELKSCLEAIDISAIRKISDVTNSLRTVKYKHKTGKVTKAVILRIIKSAKSIKELDHCKKEIDAQIELYSDAKRLHPKRAEQIEQHLNWLKQTVKGEVIPAKEKELKEKAVVESFINKIDDVCDKLDNVIESHEDAYNAAMESLYVNYNDQKVFAPVIKSSDCNSDNLHFAYKVKSVCEGLKGITMDAETDLESKQVERMIECNLRNIENMQSAIYNKPGCGYKYGVLESAKGYLNKINSRISIINESLAGMENTSEEVLIEATQFIDSLLESASNTDLLESTRDEQMELVMAEAITRYTILESFNTLNLINLTRDDVRQMARKNIQ